MNKFMEVLSATRISLTSLRQLRRTLYCYNVVQLNRKGHPGRLQVSQKDIRNNNVIVNAVSPVLISRYSDFPMTDLVYGRLSNSTLDELAEYFEELPEFGNCPADYDVQYGNGVLSIKVGNDIGTYVINKQAPNKQIWLSSPVSGPKRYDLVDGYWTYRHDGSVLHNLLAKEFSEHLNTEINLSTLENYHRLSNGDAWS